MFTPNFLCVYFKLFSLSQALFLKQEDVLKVTYYTMNWIENELNVRHELTKKRGEFHYFAHFVTGKSDYKKEGILFPLGIYIYIYYKCTY